MNKQEYIFKLKSLRNIISKQLLLTESEELNDKRTSEIIQKVYDACFDSTRVSINLDALIREGKITKELAEQFKVAIERRMSGYTDKGTYSFDAELKDFGSGDAARKLLDRLQMAENSMKLYGKPDSHMSTLNRAAKIAYISVGVVLILTTVFFLRYFIKSDYWKALKVSAQQGNWEKVKSVVYQILSIGILSLPAFLGICLISSVFYVERTNENIDKFLNFVNGFLTPIINNLIIIPMIKLLNHIKYS